MRVTIVGNISDGQVNGPAEPVPSGTDEPSHAQLTPLDHKSFKAKSDSHVSTIDKIEQPIHDPIVLEPIDDVHTQPDAIKQTEPAGRPEAAQTDFNQSDLVTVKHRGTRDNDTGSETGTEVSAAIWEAAHSTARKRIR